MGGELEKSTMHQKTIANPEGKTASRNHKAKLQSIATNSPSKKSNAKTASKTTLNNNNEVKIDKGKKNKERVSVVSLEKDKKNEIAQLKLLQEKSKRMNNMYSTVLKMEEIDN